MDHATAQRCIALVAASRDSVHTVDITGGAPELNAEFRCCGSCPRVFRPLTEPECVQ